MITVPEVGNGHLHNIMFTASFHRKHNIVVGL